MDHPTYYAAPGAIVDDQLHLDRPPHFRPTPGHHDILAPPPRPRADLGTQPRRVRHRWHHRSNLLTGDAAFSGKRDQYIAVTAFFEKLLARLKLQRDRLVTLTHEGELALWDARAVEELGRLSRKGADDSCSFYEPQFSGDDALITRARERLLALGAAGAGSGAVDSRGASR